MDNEVGYLAYVEAVFPDDVITISEANFPDAGIYNERSLTKEEWKDLRPIFIQFSKK
jgi:surface antigen